MLGLPHLIEYHGYVDFEVQKILLLCETDCDLYGQVWISRTWDRWLTFPPGMVFPHDSNTPILKVSRVEWKSGIWLTGQISQTLTLLTFHGLPSHVGTTGNQKLVHLHDFIDRTYINHYTKHSTHIYLARTYINHYTKHSTHVYLANFQVFLSITGFAQNFILCASWWPSGLGIFLAHAEVQFDSHTSLTWFFLSGCLSCEELICVV